MSEAEDRYRQGIAERGKSPPWTSGDPFHWDGSGTASQGAERTPVSELVPPGSRDLLPVPPALTSDWDKEADALSWYLDPGLLLATGCDMIPGATGQLLWVPLPHKIEFPIPVAHRALLVHTVYEALQVEYMELVLHLPLHDPLHRHIALVLQAEREAEGGAGHLYAQSLADALVVHFLRRYAAVQSSLREATLRISFESPDVYQLFYTVRDQRVGATIPYTIHGQERWKTVLNQFGLNDAEIDIISKRVEEGISYVLELSHIDRETAEQLLRSASTTDNSRPM